jgi:hypothetical protein
MNTQTSILEDQKDQNYTQLCIWPATEVGNSLEKIEEFTAFMLEHFNARVQYLSEQLTNQDPGDSTTGGRNDLFFYIHKDDIGHFAMPRLRLGIRWWEDVFFNNQEYLYSEEFIEANPKTW